MRFENLLTRPDPTRPVRFRTPPDSTRHAPQAYRNLLTRLQNLFITVLAAIYVGALYQGPETDNKGMAMTLWVPFTANKKKHHLRYYKKRS